GIKAGGLLNQLFKYLEIKDVSAKIIGSRNKLNVVRAAFLALDKLTEKIITQAGPGAGMGNLHADARSNSFNFSVIPFDYRGEKIKAIKIIGGNQEHFSYYVNNHSGKKLLAINFDAEKAKVIDWVDTAFPFLDGSYKVKKWLELTETGLGITRKKLAVDAFSPTIKTIKLIFSNQEELKEYVKQVKEK
ncbi:17272_t:CDS:2, partial [Racocetra persica]